MHFYKINNKQKLKLQNVWSIGILQVYWNTSRIFRENPWEYTKNLDLAI